MTDIQVIHQTLRGLMGTHGDPYSNTACQAILDGNDAMSALSRIADLTTLHPASEWTEADGEVLCWHIEFGEIVGDPVVSRPVGAVGSLARAAWEQSLPFWSRRPQVELPAMAKDANHAR